MFMAFSSRAPVLHEPAFKKDVLHRACESGELLRMKPEDRRATSLG